MRQLYKWRMVFKKNLKIKKDKSFIHISHGRLKHSLTSTPELWSLIDSILEHKHFLVLGSELSSIQKMLFALKCVELELLDSKQRIIFSIDFYLTKTKSRVPKKLKLSETCYFHQFEKGFTLKSMNSSESIRFHSLRPLEDWDTQEVTLKGLIYAALSQLDCIKTSSEAGTWEFHEILFHHKSKSTNFYFKKRPKILENKIKKKTIALIKSESLIAQRKSRRSHSTAPISFKKISSLLYSLARKKKKDHLFFGKHYKGVYPSAGGTYENEFYLLTHNCQKLPLGLYKYDGFKHQLINLDIAEDYVMAMLKMAGFRINQKEKIPSAVIIVTSKLPLLQKKYSMVPYRLSLLNVGVVTGYLDYLACELGLAGCPTGSTDWKIFEEVTGIDHREETAMMEYVLGEISLVHGKENEEEKY